MRKYMVLSLFLSASTSLVAHIPPGTSPESYGFDHGCVGKLGLFFETDANSALIGNSASMVEVRRLIRVFAKGGRSVLITGETGTGKELVARELHERSPVGNRAMFSLNTANLDEGTCDSEIFGHVRGAFTGAVAEREGAFAAAEDSTLFLDEIGDMHAGLQAKLLRAIQFKKYRRLGENQEWESNARIIAATSGQKMREDLRQRFERTIEVPPLRERREDIPLLIQHFLKKESRRGDGKRKRVSAEAMQILLSHPWPGNVRELEFAIGHAVDTSEKRLLIAPLDLPVSIQKGAPFVEPPQEAGTETDTNTIRIGPFSPGNPPLKLNHYRDEVTARVLVEVLAYTKGNQSQAAALLGISRTRLRGGLIHNGMKIEPSLIRD